MVPTRQCSDFNKYVKESVLGFVWVYDSMRDTTTPDAQALRVVVDQCLQPMQGEGGLFGGWAKMGHRRALSLTSYN